MRNHIPPLCPPHDGHLDQAAAEFSQPYRERIAELEERLAEQDAEHEKLVSAKRRAEARVRAWEERTGESGPSAPRIVGAKLNTMTVDGKTPGQVAFEVRTTAVDEATGQPPSGDSWDKVADWRRETWETAARAVLRAFGNSPPGQTPQANAVEALQRVRDRINADDLDSFNVAGSLGLGPNAAITKFGVRRIVDDEIAKLEAKPAPTSSHVHEIGSCSHCDKGDASHNKINREVTQ